jgi:hypothetical protein
MTSTFRHYACLWVNDGLAIQAPLRPLSVVPQSRPKWSGAANAVLYPQKGNIKPVAARITAYFPRPQLSQIFPFPDRTPKAGP